MASTRMEEMATLRYHLWSEGMTNQGACLWLVVERMSVVGVFVLGPEFALVEVGLGELPLLVGCVDAVLQAPCLLGVGDVEEELEDDDVVVGEHSSRTR